MQRRTRRTLLAALALTASGALVTAPLRAEDAKRSGRTQQAPAAATLTAAQQTKLRDALSFGGNVSMQFGYSAAQGFTLTFGIEGDETTGQTTSRQIAAWKARPAPGDAKERAEYFHHLADLHGQAKDDNGKKAALREAEKALQERLASGDSALPSKERGVLLARLGSIQDDLDEPDAEKRLREAVIAAPDAWETWSRLGTYLSSKANRLIFQSNTSTEETQDLSAYMFNPQAALDYWRAHRPTPGQWTRIQALRAESLTSFDRAVTLAPEEPSVYQARAGARFGGGFMDFLDRAVRGETKQNASADFLHSFVTPEVVADMERSAALTPHEVAPFLTAWLFRTFSQAGSDNFGTTFANAAGELASHMEAIAENTGATRIQRVAAYEAATTFYAVGKQVEKSRAAVTRGLLLEPQNPDLHVARVVALLQAGKIEALHDTLLEDQRNGFDTPRRRVFLAKTDLRLGRPADAEKDLRAARQRFPSSASIALALAVICLKNRGAEPATLREVNALLKSAETQKGPENGLTAGEKTTLQLTRAAHAALSGNPTQAATLADQAAKEHPDDEDVRALRAALPTR